MLNANPGPGVDHVCNATDLSRFADNTFTDIYASHVVEHFDYVNVLLATLREWYRVLQPGGKACISVPDLDVLAKLFIANDQLSLDERFFVMRMIFGGHVDQYDYHVVGLNEEFLTRFLRQAGYVNIKRVKEFGYFNDSSCTKFKDVPISVNITAEKS